MSLISSRSIESAQESKRILMASKNSSSFSASHSGAKRKKINPKSPGVAWGSSSRSSSRSSFQNSAFSDFGSYMALKNKKLHEQFDARAANISNGNPIFRGVCIFVDGFTVPSRHDLKACMLSHGGRFENYFSRDLVTHIICSNLPQGKTKNVRPFSGRLPVLKPSWVLDCVAASKLLSWYPYQLDQISQPKLSSFFILKSFSSSPSSPIIEFTDGKTDGANKEERGEALSPAEHGDPHLPPHEIGDEEGAVKSLCSDPNFVEKYFENSRLHFIGTWRNRYRRKFRENERRNSGEWKAVTVIHVDMDCFFVSVLIRNRPELRERPVAVCHSDSARGTAEISSANYPARRHGVRAGIFLRDARALCPNLITLPYDFEAYENVADQFYTVLHGNCGSVRAVSCDEAFLYAEGEDAAPLVSRIRREIEDVTGCTASAGISTSEVVARIATRAAKPNGQVIVRPADIERYLSRVPVRDLPGVGRVLAEKLGTRFGVDTCGELRMVSKGTLRTEFGPKTGEMLWRHSHGLDPDGGSVAVQEGRSVGAEVNWAVRFGGPDDARGFLLNLCKEVSLRVKGCGLRGRTVTLKLKRRKEEAPEPIKFMGCGDCHNLSRSLTVPTATNDLGILQTTAWSLFRSLNVDPVDIRGVGVQMSKLERDDGPSRSSLHFLSGGSRRPRPLTPPPLHELDPAVVRDLPPDVFSEMNEVYAGKLDEYIRRSHGKNDDGGGGDDVLSLTQVDPSVLRELPDEVRGDIVRALPAHRTRHRLWSGCPPAWVDVFKKSGSPLLDRLAEGYLVVGCAVEFSRVLSGISDSGDGSGDAVAGMSELLRQYVAMKVESDIEEIYTTFCVLRGLAVGSEFFTQVFRVVSFDLHSSVLHCYGGNLNVPP